MKRTMIKKEIYKQSFVLLYVLTMSAVLFSAISCDKDDDNSLEKQEQNFECTNERDGWEQCVDNKVQYCHVLEGTDPHFHWGADCDALGLECMAISESVAVCLDESTHCEAGEFKCENNIAYNCVAHGDNGHFAVKPCGTAATCHEHEDEAHCEQAESDFEPQDACNAISSDEEEAKATVSLFDSVFSEDYHADLGIRIHVTLPDNEVSYIHFEVFTCGEFAVFMDQTEVFDGILHRDGTEILTSGGTAVGVCESDIPEHWHADLEWDGDGIEGEDPVPYVIRFKAMEGGADVHFVVFQVAAEE